VSNPATGPRPTAWVGWIAFAAAMIIVVGAMNVINGLAAIFEDEIFIGSGAFVLDVTGWGWIHLIVGLILVGTGVALIRGALWAAITASVLVVLNMISQMFLLPASPIWSLVIIILDAFVLYALTVHGDERIGDL
jgi:hypothetical protein